MKYTGKFWTTYSEKHGMQVNILEYKRDYKGKIPYMPCDRCGKGIINKMYVVQDAETDCEIEYLGSECIKHFK